MEYKLRLKAEDNAWQLDFASPVALSSDEETVKNISKAMSSFGELLSRVSVLGDAKLKEAFTQNIAEAMGGASGVLHQALDLYKIRDGQRDEAVIEGFLRDLHRPRDEEEE